MRRTTIKQYPTVRLLLLLVAFPLAVLTVEPEEFDYCTIECDDKARTHTMCKYTDEISDFCVSFELQTHISQPNLIDLHNSFRNEYAKKHGVSNMMFLTWDNELEDIATRWAEQCVEGNDECRDVERFQVSQNAGMVQFPQGKTSIVHHPAIFEKWVYEAKFCTAKKLKRWSVELHEEKCGRLTNIIWANVSHFACADAVYMVSKTTVQRILVCNYGPAGNVPGQSVFQPGPPCSRCPQGTRCYPGSKYSNLCALKEVKHSSVMIQERSCSQHLSPQFTSHFIVTITMLSIILANIM